VVITTILLIACALAATLFITALTIGWWSTTARHKTKERRR
jgi:hypothetical protein